MKSTRDICGCALAERAAKMPRTGNRSFEDAQRQALLDDAEEARRRWGCPNGNPGGHLDPDLRAEARYVASVTGTPEATTCPLACVMHASPWLAEITRAVSLATDWHVSIPETLGRDLTRADIEALAALKRGQHEAWKSDQEIAEQERESAAKHNRGRGAR